MLWGNEQSCGSGKFPNLEAATRPDMNSRGSKPTVGCQEKVRTVRGRIGIGHKPAGCLPQLFTLCPFGRPVGGISQMHSSASTLEGLNLPLDVFLTEW